MQRNICSARKFFIFDPFKKNVLRFKFFHLILRTFYIKSSFLLGVFSTLKRPLFCFCGFRVRAYNHVLPQSVFRTINLY